MDNNLVFIETFLKKIHWGKTNAVDIIFSEHPLLNDVKNSFNKYNELFQSSEEDKNKDKPFNTEINIICRYINDCSAWQKSVKSLLNKHVERKKENEKALKDIEETISKEEKLADTYSKKNKFLQKVLNHKTENFNTSERKND